MHKIRMQIKTQTQVLISSFTENVNMGVYWRLLRMCDKYQRLMCWPIFGIVLYKSIKNIQKCTFNQTLESFVLIKKGTNVYTLMQNEKYLP